jgi:hypothetical protein
MVEWTRQQVPADFVWVPYQMFIVVKRLNVQDCILEKESGD